MEIIDNSYDCKATSDEKENRDSNIYEQARIIKSENSTIYSTDGEKTEIDLHQTKILNQKIDSKSRRYPYCIFWTPLPLISWFLPFIGHAGICG